MIVLSRSRIPVWVGILSLSCMFLMGQGSECPWGDAAEILDPNLEEQIRHCVGLDDPYYSGPLCTSTLLQVYTLYANHVDIENLRGLEYCSFLVLAILSDNRITDLGPLAGLPLLYDLRLDSNPISDLGPLAGLTSLSNLYIGNSQVTDISPLAGLTKLGVLHLQDNQISDLSPLAGLTDLWDLRLFGNLISDLSPLAGLTTLSYLRPVWQPNQRHQPLGRPDRH